MRKLREDANPSPDLHQKGRIHRLPFVEITLKPVAPDQEAYVRQLAEAWKRFECLRPDNATVQ
ncbi:MAG TPA: hypothetical protein VKU00_21930 [Chthonomonadaceae bacterium]|nr:hypothetical protein [Chthonomonadaceae bacterium]